MKLWTLIKDVLLTGTGLAIIGWQVFLSRQPSTEGLIAGLALTGIGASFHVGALISGHAGGPSSSSPPPQSSLSPGGNHQ